MLRLSKLNIKTKMIPFSFFLTLVTDEEIRNYECNKGLFWLDNGDYFIAVNNLLGQVDIGEFKRFEECINWLITSQGSEYCES